MAIVVRKVPMESVQDTAGIEAAMAEEGFGVDDIVALVAKTEGNGGVNDLGRILVDRVLRDFLVAGGSGGREAAMRVPIALSGGCPGVISPHINVFARVDDPDPDPEAERLAMGIAMSEAIAPEDIGRPAGVEKVAAGVRLAMKDAGIEDASDIHYVQSKSPLLTVETIADAKARGHTVATEETMESMSIANATAALGIGYALGEIPMPREDQIGRDFDVYSSVASCSSGNEQLAAQIVVVGNRKGAGGRFRIGHSVMKDAIDSDGSLRGDPRRRVCRCRTGRNPSDLGDALVNCFVKCETDPTGRLRGRRQVSLNDLRRSSHPHDQGDGGRGGSRPRSAIRRCSSRSRRLQQGPAGGGMGRGHRRHGQGACLGLPDGRRDPAAARPLSRFRDPDAARGRARSAAGRGAGGPRSWRRRPTWTCWRSMACRPRERMPGANDLLIVLEGDDGEVLAETLDAAAALLDSEARPAATAAAIPDPGGPGASPRPGKPCRTRPSR